MHHYRFKIGHPAGRSGLIQSRSTNLLEPDRPHIRSGSEAGPGAADADIIDDMMKYLKRSPDLGLHRGFCLPDLVRALVQQNDPLPIFVAEI